MPWWSAAQPSSAPQWPTSWQGPRRYSRHAPAGFYCTAGFVGNAFHVDACGPAVLIWSLYMVAGPCCLPAPLLPPPQDLARPGVVERYAASPEDAELLRVFFAGQWGLEDPAEPATAAVIADAIAHPERYVLKPQREGGGNNYYGEALAQRLTEGRGLAAYILMQRIQPPVHRSLMVRLGEAVEADTLSELGVYSTYVRCGERVVVSREAGHLVRTKAATSDE